MKYYVITGEASGDLHAAKLMIGLRASDTEAEFRCWGGDKMEQAGGKLVKHYRDLAFMGFQEVLLHIRTILGNLRLCKSDILNWKPDAIILVDYPGFNMRIAEFAHNAGYKVYYYISPQVWAWKKNRIHKLHRNTEIAFVVMPFEVEFHAKYGYKAEFTGHPLPDSIEDELVINPKEFRKTHGLSQKPIIALIPGSRKQELRRILPVMLSATKQFPDYQFVITGVETIEPSLYQKLTKGYEIKILYGQTHNLLRSSYAAAVKSGTVTLETALFNVPQVVCYRFSFLSALVAWMVVHVKFISLPNLILNRKIVTELIQYKFTAKSLSAELTPLLSDTPVRIKMLEDYQELKEKTGNPGASVRAAHKIYEHLINK